MSVTVSTINETSIRFFSRVAKVGAALAIVGAIAAAPARAEESAPRRPSAEELAILRGLLGVKPAVVQPAQPSPAPEASNPAQPPPAPVPAATPEATRSAVTSENLGAYAASDVSRAILAARSASRDLASRQTSKEDL